MQNSQIYYGGKPRWDQTEDTRQNFLTNTSMKASEIQMSQQLSFEKIPTNAFFQISAQSGGKLQEEKKKEQEKNDDPTLSFDKSLEKKFGEVSGIKAAQQDNFQSPSFEAPNSEQAQLQYSMNIILEHFKNDLVQKINEGNQNTANQVSDLVQKINEGNQNMAKQVSDKVETALNSVAIALENMGSKIEKALLKNNGPSISTTDSIIPNPNSSPSSEEDQKLTSHPIPSSQIHTNPDKSL